MGCVSSRPTRDGAIYAKEHTTSSASSQTTKHNDMAIALSAFSGNATPTFPGSIAQSPMLSLPPPSPGACTSAEAFRAAAPLLFSYPPPAISESLLGRKRSHDLLATRNHASAAPPFVRRTTTADGRPLGSVRSKSEETVRQARGDSTPASGMGSITGWQILAQQVLADMDLNGDAASSRSSDCHTSSSDCDHVAALPPSPLGAVTDAAAFAALYEHIDVLGQGAFGRAMKARRLADGRMCCIKVMPLRALLPKDRGQAAKEATLLASLHHPNIVQYCDAFYRDDALHLVMEFCGEGDLAQHLQRRRGRLLDEAEIMHMFVQISLGLHHVHKQGIMHRDLKANNIFIAANNVLKIGDFGISKVMIGETACAHSIVGTPSYLPPEICQDKPYNKKVDVWALGCVLYEMCTLKPAFRGSSVAAITIKILSGKYSPISERYSPELHALLASLLQRSPHQRPSMSELLRQPFVLRHLMRYYDKVHQGVVDEPTQQAALVDSVAIVERLGQGQGTGYSQGSLASLDTDLLERSLGSPVNGTRPARSISLAAVPHAPLPADTRPRALSVHAVPLLPAWPPSAADQQGPLEPSSPTRKRPRRMTDMQSDEWPSGSARPASAGPLACVARDSILEVPTLSPMLSMPMGVDPSAEGDLRLGPATPRGRKSSVVRVRRSRLRSLAAGEGAALAADASAVVGEHAQPAADVAQEP